MHYTQIFRLSIGVRDDDITVRIVLIAHMT